jgi:hypothetical protein
MEPSRSRSPSLAGVGRCGSGPIFSAGGRYLVTWSQDGRDLAISADATALSANQVVELANSVTLPR